MLTASPGFGNNDMSDINQINTALERLFVEAQAGSPQD
jgi:hypothetical protein